MIMCLILGLMNSPFIFPLRLPDRASAVSLLTMEELPAVVGVGTISLLLRYSKHKDRAGLVFS